MGNPFNKGPLPPLIDQGGEGITMWDKYSHSFVMHILAAMCEHCTSPTRRVSSVFHSWPEIFTTSAPT